MSAKYLAVLADGFRRFEKALLEACLSEFPPTMVVEVSCPQYHGQAIVAGRSPDCPADKIPCLLENGNVWWYPIESCSPLAPGVLREPWIVKLIVQMKRQEKKAAKL